MPLPNLPSITLPPTDALRALAGALGLRPYTVMVRIRTWSGERPGIGSRLDVNTVLTNTYLDGTLQNIRVKQVSRRDIIASGGLYADQDLHVGPITPPYPAGIFGAAGGFNDPNFDPVTQNSATEVFWNMTGPGLPTNVGAWFKKQGEEATAQHYYIILRKSAVVP